MQVPSVPSATEWNLLAAQLLQLLLAPAEQVAQLASQAKIFVIEYFEMI